MVTEAAREFISAYAEDHPRFVELARLAEAFVGDRLQDHDYSIHMISGRAKDPESLRAKVILKPYDDPATEIMDLIGVRVITYYAGEVDSIVARLESSLAVDKSHSMDKRSELMDAHRFGYRSVHLVAKVTRARDPHHRYKALRNVPFEIQVRSLLDHAWAEVEHEIVYKSGIEYPEPIRRRFSAIAGSFEILEQEFVSLRAQEDLAIDEHKVAYLQSREGSIDLDVARLVAGLEVLRPGAAGWRSAAMAGAPFAVPARTALAALRSVGITNYRTLSQTLRRQGLITSAERVASLSGLSPDEVPHLILAAIVVGYKDASTLQLYFPGIALQSSFAEVFGEPVGVS